MEKTTKLLFLLLLLPLASKSQSLSIPQVEVVADAPELQTAEYRHIYTLSEEDIAALPALSVNELLSYIPSLDVRTRGVNGVQADVQMRGGTSDQIKVYLNGVNISDPQTGHYTMNLPIDRSLISKIEVSDGAINIITRPSVTHTKADSARHNDHYNAQVTGGRWGLWEAALSGQWVRDHHWHVASAQYSQSTGYISNTDYRIANLYYATGIKDVELQVGAQYKDAGANSFYSLASQDQYDATRTAFLSARYTHEWGHWGLDAQASYRANYDRYEWHRGTATNKHLNQTAAVGVKAYYTYSIGKTMVGIEARNENILSTNLGDSLSHPHDPFVLGKNRFNINYFAQQTFHYNFFTATLALNGNYNTLSGSHLAGGVNIAFAYAQTGKVYINANRDLRLPTFTDLYYHAGIQRGNIDLQPEKKWMFQVGTEYAYKGLQLRANAFYRLGQDIIDWQLADDALYYATNTDRLDAAGSEVTLSYHYGYWLKRIEASYSYAHTFLNGVDLSKSMYLDYLSHKLILRLEHGIYKGFGASWELSYQVREGAYTTAAGTQENYQPVWLLDGSIYWANSFLRVAVDCTNMTNAKYYCFGGIEQPGIFPRASIKVTL